MRVSPLRSFVHLSPKNLQHITLLLLAVGFGSAVVIYFTAQPPVLDPLLGDFRATKSYRHQMGVIGGKSNLLMSDLIAGFEDLWVGRNLAGTVAVLTVIVTLVFRFCALHPELFAPERSATPGQKSPPPA